MRFLVVALAVLAIPCGWLGAARLLAPFERRSPAFYYIANASAGVAGSLAALGVLALAWRLKLAPGVRGWPAWPLFVVVAVLIGALGGAAAAVRDRRWYRSAWRDPFGPGAAQRILSTERRSSLDERRRTARRLEALARARGDVLPPELEAYVRRYPGKRPQQPPRVATPPRETHTAGTPAVERS
ncbi:MAG TPA: hypothetical protein VF041_20595 [Gemmatimonadaceae bacterium]